MKRILSLSWDHMVPIIAMAWLVFIGRDDSWPDWVGWIAAITMCGFYQVHAGLKKIKRSVDALGSRLDRMESGE